MCVQNYKQFWCEAGSHFQGPGWFDSTTVCPDAEKNGGKPGTCGGRISGTPNIRKKRNHGAAIFSFLPPPHPPQESQRITPLRYDGGPISADASIARERQSSVEYSTPTSHNGKETMCTRDHTQYWCKFGAHTWGPGWSQKVRLCREAERKGKGKPGSCREGISDNPYVFKNEVEKCEACRSQERRRDTEHARRAPAMCERTYKQYWCKFGCHLFGRQWTYTDRKCHEAEKEGKLAGECSQGIADNPYIMKEEVEKCDRCIQRMGKETDDV
ncbi:hypothetical protein F5Y05DRAFT_414015 [Hypoxylon sp. FL0543]|nr:hypothetical protein F5Y05DRAFT_414015 [Hypoxylon sp. FL0543]